MTANFVPLTSAEIGQTRFDVLVADITTLNVGAIVNAANRSLLGGGGVDGAIHRAGGPAILAECKKLGGCATGDAKLTTGGRLAARYVIHTVGPVYRDGDHGAADLLASAYRRSLEVAAAHGVTSIAFPSISTGAYRFPIQQAARVALKTIVAALDAHPAITVVRVVLFSAADLSMYEAVLSEIAATR